MMVGYSTRVWDINPMTISLFPTENDETLVEVHMCTNLGQSHLALHERYAWNGKSIWG